MSESQAAGYQSGGGRWAAGVRNGSASRIPFRTPAGSAILSLRRRQLSFGARFAVAGDARVALIDRWIQDKAGPYTQKTAALSILRKATWKKVGWGML